MRTPGRSPPARGSAPDATPWARFTGGQNFASICGVECDIVVVFHKTHSTFRPMSNVAWSVREAIVGWVGKERSAPPLSGKVPPYGGAVHVTSGPAAPNIQASIDSTVHSVMTCAATLSLIFLVTVLLFWYLEEEEDQDQDSIRVEFEGAQQARKVAEASSGVRPAKSAEIPPQRSSVRRSYESGALTAARSITDPATRTLLATAFGHISELQSQVETLQKQLVSESKAATPAQTEASVPASNDTACQTEGIISRAHSHLSHVRHILSADIKGASRPPPPPPAGTPMRKIRGLMSGKSPSPRRQSWPAPVITTEVDMQQNRDVVDGTPAKERRQQPSSPVFDKHESPNAIYSPLGAILKGVDRLSTPVKKKKEEPASPSSGGLDFPRPKIVTHNSPAATSASGAATAGAAAARAAVNASDDTENCDPTGGIMGGCGGKRLSWGPPGLENEETSVVLDGGAAAVTAAKGQQQQQQREAQRLIGDADESCRLDAGPRERRARYSLALAAMHLQERSASWANAVYEPPHTVGP